MLLAILAGPVLGIFSPHHAAQKHLIHPLKIEPSPISHKKTPDPFSVQFLRVTRLDLSSM
jgi:hypothetical protein